MRIRTAIALTTLASACGTPHTFLPVPFSAVPPPGLCRVHPSSSAARDCDDIEWDTEPRSIVLYRPDDDSRYVVVCYMSDSERGRIDGVEVFDIDTRRLVHVIQRYGEPTVGTCQNALWALVWRQPTTTCDTQELLCMQ